QPPRAGQRMPVDLDAGVRVDEPARRHDPDRHAVAAVDLHRLGPRVAQLLDRVQDQRRLQRLGTGDEPELDARPLRRQGTGEDAQVPGPPGGRVQRRRPALAAGGQLLLGRLQLGDLLAEPVLAGVQVGQDPHQVLRPGGGQLLVGGVAAQLDDEREAEQHQQQADHRTRGGDPRAGRRRLGRGVPGGGLRFRLPGGAVDVPVGTGRLGLRLRVAHRFGVAHRRRGGLGWGLGGRPDFRRGGSRLGRPSGTRVVVLVHRYARNSRRRIPATLPKMRTPSTTTTPVDSWPPTPSLSPRNTISAATSTLDTNETTNCLSSKIPSSLARIPPNTASRAATTAIGRYGWRASGTDGSNTRPSTTPTASAMTATINVLQTSTVPATRPTATGWHRVPAVR